MNETTNPKSKVELPIDALILQCENDRYKIGYGALRWAKEIKQKENLPEPIPILIPRALRELLTGKVTLKEIEKLPMFIKITTTPAPTAAAVPTVTPPSTPTLTVKTDSTEEEKADQKTEK